MIDPLTDFEIRVLETTGSLDCAIAARDFIEECIAHGLIQPEELAWLAID